MERMTEEILLFLQGLTQERELPFATITEIRNHLVFQRIYILGDAQSKITFSSAMRYLIGEEYICQDFQHFSITSRGTNQVNIILHPPVNYQEIALEESRRSNSMQQINIIIAIVSLFIAVFGTAGGIIFASQKGESRPFTGKAAILLSQVVDANNQVVVSSPLSSWFVQTPENLEIGGVPYNLSKTSPVVETGSENSRNPATMFVPIDVPNPLRIHLLINMSYGSTRFTGGREIQGTDICYVTLYSEQNQKTYALKAGVDIREWVMSSSGVVSTVGDHVQVVWRGNHIPSGQEAVIDHIVIPVPENWQSERLRYIKIEDRSQDLQLGIDPGIMVFGITVEYRK